MDWLKAICVPDGYSEIVRAPFVMAVDGQEWTCASDGHMLIAVRGAHVESRKEYPVVAPWIRQASTLTPSVDFAALRVFAGVPPAPSPCSCQPDGPVCDECDGSGEVECDMGYDHPCEDCQSDGPCSRCDGRGFIRPKARPGSLDGFDVDLNLLAPLHHVTAERVGIRVEPWSGEGGAQPALIAGPEWVLVVMPIRTYDAERPRFPLQEATR